MASVPFRYIYLTKSRSPVCMLAAVTIGGGMMGIWGMLLREDVNRGLDKEAVKL